MAGLATAFRVVDAATLAAGPLIATWLGEHGADVIKVEQPDGGDPLRQWGAQRDGVGLMWKSVSRNKRSVTANLRHEAGRDLDEVDTAITEAYSYPMGPFALLDVVGTDVALAIQEELLGEFGHESLTPAGTLRELVAAGKLGRKTKEGFRTY